MNPRIDPPHRLLSDRNLDVLKLLALGHTKREIADSLGVSEKTVDNHKRRVMRAVEVRNLVQLCRYAIRNQLIEP